MSQIHLVTVSKSWLPPMCHNNYGLIIIGVRQYYKQFPYQPLPQKMFEQKCTALIDLLSSIDFDQCLVFSNYHLRYSRHIQVLQKCQKISC